MKNLLEFIQGINESKLDDFIDDQLEKSSLEYRQKNPKRAPLGAENTAFDFPKQDGESDTEYIARLESYMALDKEDIKKANERLKKYWVDLPYKTQIYNKGVKNKDFKITRANMYNTMRNAEHRYLQQESHGNIGDDDWSFSARTYMSKQYMGVLMDIAPDDITYEKSVDFDHVKDSTNDFKNLPNVKELIYTEPYWEENKSETKIIIKILNSYSKYFKSGKLNVEFTDAPDGYSKDYIYMKVIDPDFVKDKEDKLEKLTDPKTLNDLKDSFDKETARLATEAEKNAKEEAERLKKQEEAIAKQQKADQEERDELVKTLKSKGASEKDIKQALYDLYRSKEYERAAKRAGDWTGD